MMKKPSKSPLGILKIALLIPAVLLTLGLTTGMTPQQKTVKGKVIFADTGAPATGASLVVKGGTLGCVVDQEGLFMLNVDGDPELVISFVGYSTLIVKASDIGKKPLKLEVKTYEMDLASVALEVKKDDSGTITIKTKDGYEVQPIFVVDGERVVGSVEEMDPNEIESISVLKDQNDPLVKKYKAKDGIILITTIDGKKKKDETEKSSSILLKQKDGSLANPVFLVDGKELESIDDIDPECIGSINVIKDPDHYLIKKYNAKDGLIMIETKEGEIIYSPKASKKIGETLASNESDEEVFFIVEDMPEFPGGKPALKTYIYGSLKYPERARTEGKEGEAVVRFMINENGKVVKSEVLRSSYPEFDAPALKVINEMPDWTPGYQRGKAVKVWFVMPIKFNDQKL